MMWLLLLVFMPISIFSMQHDWASYVNPGVLVDGIDERYEEFDAQLSYLIWQCVTPTPVSVSSVEATQVSQVQQPTAAPLDNQIVREKLKRGSIAVRFAQGTYCNVCKKGFSSRFELFNHRRKYHPCILPFVCLKCGKRYTLRICLIRHLAKTHKVAAPSGYFLYNCPCIGCEHSYVHRQGLLKHLKIVHKFYNNN